LRAELEGAHAQQRNHAADVAKFTAGAATAAATIKGLEGDRANLQAQITRLRADLDTCSAEKNALRARAENLNSDLSRLTAERDEFSAELEKQRAQPAPVATVEQLRARSADDETPFTAACPQHLSDVKGIGSVYETRLYVAGIGSYWELAQLSDAELKRILQLTDLQAKQMDFRAVRANARRLARETKSLGRRWSRGRPDDFEPLEGIGKTYEKRLYDAGICTYEALASATVELLEGICHAPAQFKPDYAAWIKQARTLAAKKAKAQAASGGNHVSQ
jgi:predicted flap endonuclease-1-like 5' DNA nuclease